MDDRRFRVLNAIVTCMNGLFAVLAITAFFFIQYRGLKIPGFQWIIWRIMLFLSPIAFALGLVTDRNIRRSLRGE